MSNFLGHYVPWREKRINKILEIFGKEYFKDKTILELGCGYGDIGTFFETLGARVTFADGRPEHIDEVKRRHNYNVEAYVIDQNEVWNLNKKFNIIIHTGVLYHLENWKQDLECTLQHGDLIILESEVANRSADDFEVFVPEDPENYNDAISGRSIRASASHIEKHLTELGASFIRYDDSELNTPSVRYPDHLTHVYDWVVNDNNRDRIRGQRRFWVVRRD